MDRGDSTMNRGGIILCYCRVRALRMISNITTNPGRSFYRCPFWNDDARKCKYF
ncbi:hypothetical protein CDL15_Pgr009365 [Punica granatum]|uniref:GRF-type domain-containing protein n=1 Tax=Punica granatum TaxID=22663 RepID=A0A218XH49_PUNGR|nr:hypothetical protein CDL15_Pgr009365 [Punica granatum]